MRWKTCWWKGAGYGPSGAFWKFCQAVAECLINDSADKSRPKKQLRLIK
jgi:hypothetical protein